jgi:hypothetical protein
MKDELAARRLKLQHYNDAELIEGLGWILDQAMHGKISGACFIIKHNRYQHTVGVLGKYRDDPYCALPSVKKLKVLLKQFGIEIEEHSKIEHTY